MTPLPNECEVAVVGLGPAGAMAAMRLAQLGIDVVGMDRSIFPRYKVCGGCLNSRALRSLRQAGIDIDQLGGIGIHRFECAVGRRHLSLDLPNGLAVSRSRLDANLADAARSAGAVLAFGAKCSGLERAGSRWEIEVESDGAVNTLRAGVVVAADGLGGTIRKNHQAFRTVTLKSARIGAGALLEPSSAYEPGAIHMAVGRAGYVGLTVVEDGRLNVAAAFDAGFVRETGSPAHAALSVLQSCRLPIPVDLLEGPWKGTPPLSQRTWPVSAEGLFLLGDSAGYVEPFTGEGMSWALEGGLALSEIIVKVLRNEVTGAEYLWNAAYRRQFRAAQRRCRLISRGLRSPVISATVAGILGAVPALARPVIANLNATAE